MPCLILAACLGHGPAGSLTQRSETRQPVSSQDDVLHLQSFLVLAARDDHFGACVAQLAFYKV